MPEFPEFAQLTNAEMIEGLYQKYLADPESVDISWRHFFQGVDFGSFLSKRGTESVGDASSSRIQQLIVFYRRFGHLKASFNPLEEGDRRVAELDLEHLGFSQSELEQLFPTLGFCGKKEAPLKEIIEALEKIYCSRIGFEYTHCDNPELEQWIQKRLEPEFLIQTPVEEKHLLLEALNNSEVFEAFLHTKYVGQTRFSLEGAETMIPLLSEVIDFGAQLGIEEFYLGMAHRGRLNVLVNILNKPLEAIFQEFEDDTTLSFNGNDDVKYHMGFSADVTTRSEKKVRLELAANPSHLESVSPVVMGQVRAKQVLKGDQEKRGTSAILIHGDASIAGQGIVYETLQLMNLPDYSIGGSIHLVVNNQIGYTTLPSEARSTHYCTDIAKAFGCPIFHINGEDPESCLYAAKLATEIKQKFQCDVFLDLLCYRKYGHNEGDEPSFTQPIQYKKIRAKKTVRQLYVEQLLAAGHVEQKIAEALEMQLREKLKTTLSTVQGKVQGSGPTKEGRPREEVRLPRATTAPILQAVIEKFCEVPGSFHLHPKLQKWLQDRKPLQSIDWATAECLAFGSLLWEGSPVRLAGQDVQRGTFSQRHLIWVDVETSTTYCPLCHLKPNQGRLDVVNSPLSEYACMGFEVGYSWTNEAALVLWEAQYGDFFNGAQIVIDQYIASAQQKWNCPSSLTLLLPHAYEGAGPEHSSARIERFLQLAANDNIQLVNASTPAQYFHLLRRQALQRPKKPLIVFTPKSLLRHPACTSQFNELVNGEFEEFLDDSMQQAKRLLFCTGKVYYDLVFEREKRKSTDVAIIRIEQLYPLKLEEMKKIIAKYSGFKECFWVQEEPENMGAWSFIGPYLQAYLPQGILLQYAGRKPNPTTATGSSRKHKQEQQALLDRSFS